MSTAMRADTGRNSRKPKLLRRKLHRYEADTGGVATEPKLDRISPGHKDDRNGRGRRLGRERGRGISDDQGCVPTKKVRHQKRQPVSFRALLDRDVLAVDEACFLWALAKRSHAVEQLSGRSTAEKPQQRDRRLLGGRVAAAPPSSAMNSRRLIRSPRRRGRAAKAAHRGAPWWS
jgi:hypothetical protein